MVIAADTVWILISTALVMLMVPGLAFFYSGMVRDKNVISTIMHSYIKLCVISVVWVLWGYSLAFGDSSLGGFIGDFSFLGYLGVGFDALSGMSIPHMLFATFQGMFAVITVAIITGSFAERVKIGPILFFSILWITFVYAPIAHWVWGGGWLGRSMEILDFAGGGVVHINAAVAGLVATIYIGKRKDFKDSENQPHNITLTAIGASLLWFGWFGFNAGSALAADKIAVIALVNTNVAAASAGFTWFLIEMFCKKKPTMIGTISGSIAGLVAITPAAGFVHPLSAIIIGISASIICYYSIIYLKQKLNYDDSLDVFGIHGIAGFWGAIATGIFASTSINADAIDGLIHGNINLVINQIISSLIIICYSALATFIILKLIRSFVSIRVSQAEEFEGLDLTLHGEKGYNINNGKGS